MPYFERGHVYDMLTQYGKALVDYEKAVDLDPENPEFHHDLAWFFYHCVEVSYRDLHLALVHATRAVELAPQNTQYRSVVANIDLQLGRRAEALAELRKIQELKPNSPETYYVASTFYRRTGDPREALVNARKAAELAPDNAWFHHQVAGLLSKLGEDEKALAAINKAIEVNPKPNSTGTFYLHDQRGDIHWRLGMHAAAIEDFDKSLELAPFRSFTYKRRAAAHFHFKDYAKALADIAKAVELNPGDLSALSWGPLSQVATCPDERFRQGLLELADKAIELNDHAARAYAARGWILAALGQEEKALADLKTAFDGQPKEDEPGELDLSSAVYELGHLCGLLAHRREAIPYLAKMAELQPEDPVCSYRAALAQLGDGQTDSYGDTCHTMLQQFQDTETPANGYWVAWTCLLGPGAVDDYGPVVQMAELAVEAEPDSVPYVNTLGAILYRAGRFEEAVGRLTEANKLIEDPDTGSKSSPAYTWYFLAMAHHKLAHEGEAHEWLEKATEWTDKVLNDQEEATTAVPWNRRLTLKLLRAEAAAMIETDDK